jgi:AAA15 family ATPase/GTPase
MIRLTKISLTNFRSFKKTQTIDLAPVTLMFGPNSVGKSSVLMALAYIQQILEHGHCDPQKLAVLGNKDIGGFRSLVHGQNLRNKIKIRLDFDCSLFKYGYETNVSELANLAGEGYLLMNDISGAYENGAVEFEIAWSEQLQKAYVENYRVWGNEHYIGSIHSSSDLKDTYIKEINNQNPLLRPYDHDQWLENEYGGVEEVELDDEDLLETELSQLLLIHNPNGLVYNELADTETAGEYFVNHIARIALGCFSGAIPFLGRPVVTNLSGQDLDESENLGDHLNYLVLRQTLSEAFVSPLDGLIEYLKKSVFIGPLRVVPDQSFKPNPNPEQADWFDGTAAWDYLFKAPSSSDQTKELISRTNDWLTAKEKLNTGYEILNNSLSEVNNLGAHNSVMGLLEKRHVFFKETRSNILLSASQLGTGISQVLPLVVAANNDKVSLVTIEQPELHIHPRFQVELADLLLCNREKHSFLVETHSEHLILRLLKRIRQTTDSEHLMDCVKVEPETVSIVYLEPTNDGVKTKRIRLDEDGEFLDNWPAGFFTERREELM